MESGRALGMDWKPTDKYIRPEKCPLHCGQCVIGCTTGAKWTAREFLNEAEQNGAKNFFRTTVDKVLTKGGQAVGVTAHGSDGAITIKANTVVVSAGGVASPNILQRSGLKEVGDGFMCDPVHFVYGVGPEYGNMFDVPISAAAHLEDDGILLSDISCSRIFNYGILAYTGVKGLSFMRKASKRNKLLCVMVKVKDELNGRVNEDSSIYKPIDEEAQKRIKKGSSIAKEILLKSGVKSKNIVVGKAWGGHPGGTVPLGKHIDNNCQTGIKNCYCIDNSIIPEPLGVATVAHNHCNGKAVGKTSIGG